MLQQLQFINSAGVPIELYHVKSEDLILLRSFMSLIERSNMLHNKGEDGLFLHSISVTHEVQKTQLFKEMSNAEKRLITIMALYQEYLEYFSIDFSSMNACRMVESQLAYRITQKFTGLLLVCFHIHYNDCLKYMSQWVKGRQGFNSVIDMTLDKGFLLMIMEIARCKALDIGYSLASGGLSRLLLEFINVDDFETEKEQIYNGKLIGKELCHVIE